jgi:hypothetical protein
VTDTLGPISKVARALMIARWVLLVLLPPIAAFLTFLAAESKGATRTNLWLGLIFTALLLAFLQIYGEIQEWKASKASVSARVALASALDQEARPLVTVLSRVAETNDMAERRVQVNTLVTLAAGIASSQCGKLAGVRCSTRSVYYEFTSPDRLSRVCQSGRTGRVARPDFVKSRNDHDRSVIDRAEGENAFLFPDLGKPDLEQPHIDDNVRRDYQCFIMVPVRTSKRSYGFLSVDSDKPRTLTDTDVGFTVLLAGIMASAIALLDEEYPNLGGRHDSLPSERP